MPDLTTQDLFDELAEERSIVAPSEERAGWKARESWVRRELRERKDLGEVLSRVLTREPPPPADAPVLVRHRRLVRIKHATSLLEMLEPASAFALIIAAQHGDAGVSLPLATSMLVARAPEMWPRALDRGTTSLPILRYVIARLERDLDRAKALEGALVPLARAGVAGDLVYPLLARVASASALAAVRAAAEDVTLPPDTRTSALRAHPDAGAIAHALVAARTHDAGWSLVRAVLRLLQATGVDAAFRMGDGERAFESPEALGDAIVRWTEAAPERIDVGLVPMHESFDGGGHLPVSLAVSRNQQFVVNGNPVWAIRHYHIDDLEDPNLVTPRAAPIEGPISRHRLRQGPHLEGTLTMTFTRREPGEHPFASAWSYEEDDDDWTERPTLDVAWWHGERRGLEVALLPLATGGGAPEAFAWPMPGSKADEVRLYAIVLAGEATLDACAREGKPVTITLVAPVATAQQRVLLSNVLR